MIYLIPMFDCFLLDDELIHLKANAKYKVVERGTKCGIVFGLKNEIPFVLDLKHQTDNILKVSLDRDDYYFIFPTKFNSFFTTKFLFQGKEVVISLSHKITVTLDGVLICEQNVENLNYSHYEINKNMCFIYFNGDRNFVIILKDESLCFADYYDEFNEHENEKFFMCKLQDSLNHGKVCHIENGNSDTYLVYLDNEELNLKQEFVPFVFLDCVKASNLNYCNALLNDNIKMKNKDDIKKFFPEFDWFYPLSEKKFLLAKKNTLAGIYAFEVENNKIINITNL